MAVRGHHLKSCGQEHSKFGFQNRFQFGSIAQRAPNVFHRVSVTFINSFMVFCSNSYPSASSTPHLKTQSFTALSRTEFFCFLDSV